MQSHAPGTTPADAAARRLAIELGRLLLSGALATDQRELIASDTGPGDDAGASPGTPAWWPCERRGDSARGGGRLDLGNEVAETCEAW